MPYPKKPYDFIKPLSDAVELIERATILDGLIKAGWNKSLLASKLQITRPTLMKKIEKYHLEPKINFTLGALYDDEQI